MVHEPYMPLSGVRRSLMGWWQRVQLGRVRKAADVTFVSIAPWLEAVRRFGPGTPVHHIPVGSNLPDMRSHREAARAELGVTEGTIVLAAFGTSHPSRLMGHVGASAKALHDAGYSVILLNLGANAPAVEGVPEAVRVEMPGLLDPTMLARRLSAADVFVAPFIDGVSSRRSTFVSALQHALPVVATDGFLTDESLRQETDACRLVSVNDRDQFANAVVELAERPVERERLARGARLLYEREFAWPVIADQVMARLHEVFIAALRYSE
jgi:glycosyltransferase involved in cell wall biosynthesis